MRPLTLHQRRQLLAATAASGVIANLEVALRATGLLLTPDVMEAAAGAGATHVCDWLRRRGAAAGTALHVAAAAGHRATCEWLVRSTADGGCGANPSPTAALAALRGGHTALAAWLMRLLQPAPDGSGDGAATADGGGGEAGQLLLPAGQLPAPASVPRFLLLTAVAEGCDLATLQQQLPGAEPAQQGEGEAAASSSSSGSSSGGGGGGAGRSLSVGQCLSLEHYAATAAGSSTPDWREKVVWLLSLLPPPPPCRSQPTGPGYSEAGGDAGSSICMFRMAAARPDAVERFAWLAARGYRPSRSSLGLSAAARAGNVEAVRCLLSLRPDMQLSARAAAAQAAAEGGHVAILAMLHGYGGGSGGSGGADADAAAKGNTCCDADEAAKGEGGAAEPEAPGDPSRPPDRRRHFPLPVSRDQLMVAAKAGHVAAVRWLVQAAAEAAAAQPFAPASHYVQAQGDGHGRSQLQHQRYLDTQLAGWVAEGGSVGLLRWLAERAGAGGGAGAGAGAGAGVGVGTWPWGGAGAGAGAGGSGPEAGNSSRGLVGGGDGGGVGSGGGGGGGFRFTAGTFMAAARGGSEAVLDYLAAECGCDMGQDGEPYALAGANGDLRTLAVLRRLSCPWSAGGRTLTLAVWWPAGGSFTSCAPPVLRWLLAAGVPADWAAARRAARRRGHGAEEVLALLAEAEAEARAAAEAAVAGF
ncbi:hypothetical protein HXX76_003088 [Chlamydomonas incerta]|uniref:Ankyrin repeat domain-containing protein n=1 Tax=Chlamydomonas incerta TaxID=51695 RepID=A0A835TCC4_CHLIN|nr:hypothetical protein HXX76_003088 [Chlamydomonas incerta]|eukprot:KAG2441466.1 hypothetical protein HXX76_003088 [Chlamydomonas incerta]